MTDNYDGLYQASFTALTDAGCPVPLADSVSDIVASGRDRDDDDQAQVDTAVKYLNKE